MIEEAKSGDRRVKNLAEWRDDRIIEERVVGKRLKIVMAHDHLGKPTHLGARPTYCGPRPSQSE